MYILSHLVYDITINNRSTKENPVKQSQQLRKTRPVYGAEVSSIFVPTGTVGGYFETMLFLDKPIKGLTHFETCHLYDSWEDNHKALENKVKRICAYGPVLPH